ncbi:hypothetical protein GCM10028796_21510 [Ramlibacter monticola]|uniref:Uncharacterized protein n=1 Tax=Ramlibacter monticola TaxID=1926872 RepID=A0A937CUW5_9BURK|nr:hypothetical protein [Ramlibacter monticola]MBL0392402.1 hypothetical protein [Ramlibacter monticola]
MYSTKIMRSDDGCFTVQTGRGLEHVAPHRPDLAALLAAGELVPTRRRPRTPASPAEQVKQRARRAVAAADLALSGGKAKLPALSREAECAINSVKPAQLVNILGEVLGRELAARDVRLARLEARTPPNERQTRQRVAEALRRARAVLA